MNQDGIPVATVVVFSDGIAGLFLAWFFEHLLYFTLVIPYLSRQKTDQNKKGDVGVWAVGGEEAVL
jgi:hypothetical protein